MADSLVIARVAELLGGGVPSTLPQCAGAIFRLGRAYDLGNPQPVVDLLMTLMGDGSRPVSWRADNRTLNLPVTILVPSTGNLAADRLTLAGARELLLEAVNADTFTVVWAPDGQNGALNLVWDCFRARAAQVTHDVIRARQLVSELTITFDALPYGRSDTTAPLTFDSPVLGQSAPPAPLTVDDYSTVASTTQVTWFAQSPVTALYSNSARWRHEITDSNSPLTYTRTLPAAVNLSAYSKMTFYLGIGADSGEFRLWQRNTPVTVTMTLTDASGRTLSFNTRTAANASADSNWPVWNQVTLTIPQGRTFTYSAVTAYQITAWNQVHTWLGRLELSATGYLSGLRATAPTSPKRPASIRGGTYTLYDIIGSAPAPLSVHCQLGFVEQQAVTQRIVLPGTPGTTNQYAAPPENPNWLSGDNTNFDTGTTGSWTGADGTAANATLTASATQTHSGGFSLRMQAATAATMTAASTTAANVAVQGVPVTPGDRVAVRAWVRAGATARSVTVGAEFFTAAGASLGITALSPVTDSTTAWTQINGRVTAPATAATGRLTVRVASPAAAELHYVDDAYLAYAVQATVVCNAAAGGGGSSTGRQNAAGGAGGGEIAWEVNLDLNPGANHAYQIGARGAPGVPVTGVSGNGTDGGDSWLTGMTTQVLAHGGKAGRGAWNPYTNGPGGAGGTGSLNGHHWDGGAGSAGDYTQWEGGGGGGGAGDGGAGAAAGTGAQHNPGAGGPAGALGIPGGAGDQGYGGQATGAGFGGDATAPGGTRPGGGGAGSASDTQQHAGSYGANGTITVIIKSYTATSTFPALLVHKPSPRAGLLAVPVLPVGGGADPPDGREYQVPQIDGQNARYASTYTAVVAAWTWNNPTAARNVTATIRQYANSGGTSAAISLTSAITPSAVANGLFVLGEITLPVSDIAPDNTDSYYTASLQSDNTTDRFLDLILLDTQADTYLLNLPSGGFTDYYIDAPDADTDLGRVMGSNQGRGSATSVLGNAMILSGGPLRLDPGDNILCVYSPAGMPTLEGDYFPHWYHERLA